LEQLIQQVSETNRNFKRLLLSRKKKASAGDDPDPKGRDK